MKRSIGWSVALLSGFFIAAGVLHFVMPARYEKIVPAGIPNHSLVVLLSGVAEVLGGLGLLVPMTRRAARWGLVILLLAIFPANLEMLRQAYVFHASQTWQIALWLRLPLQGVLIWWLIRPGNHSQTQPEPNRETCAGN